MKIYLSGKMSGLSKKEILKNFSTIEKQLTKKCPHIISAMNPAVTYYMLTANNKDSDFSYDDWLKIDFAMLDTCAAVYLLPNWEDSNGAKQEILYAWKHNKPVYFPKATNAAVRSCFSWNKKNYVYENDKELLEKTVIKIKEEEIRKRIEQAKNFAINGMAKDELREEKNNV